MEKLDTAAALIEEERKRLMAEVLLCNPASKKSFRLRMTMSRLDETIASLDRARSRLSLLDL